MSSKDPFLILLGLLLIGTSILFCEDEPDVPPEPGRPTKAMEGPLSPQTGTAIPVPRVLNHIHRVFISRTIEFSAGTTLLTPARLVRMDLAVPLLHADCTPYCETETSPSADGASTNGQSRNRLMTVAVRGKGE